METPAEKCRFRKPATDANLQFLAICRKAVKELVGPLLPTQFLPPTTKQ